MASNPRCEGSSFQEFCSEGLEVSSRWSKVCSLPHTIRAQVDPTAPYCTMWIVLYHIMPCHFVP